MAASASDQIVICSPVRTAIGAFNGSLKDTPRHRARRRGRARDAGARGSIPPPSARW